MKYRQLNGTKVSQLGFGCMRFPVIGGDNGKIDEPRAIKMLRYGIDQGVNYIDTAYPYHKGTSEEFVGRALQDGYRERINLATKSPTWLIKSYEDFDKYLNKQLDNLQTDHIDFYLMHTLDEDKWENLKKCDVFKFLDAVKKDGRVKNIGFSFHDNVKLFKEIIDSYDWDFCQMQFNYLDGEYQAGLEGLRYAGDKGIGVIVMEPLRGGKLVNNLPDEIKDKFKAYDENRSLASWGLRYVWNFPEVKVVLSGMSELEHVEDNLKTADVAQADGLTDEEKGLINKASDILHSKILVDCTACKYCMPCPHGVNIPENFEILNNASLFDDDEAGKRAYKNSLSDEEKASSCVECGKCEKACPQHIEIRKMLKVVREKFE